MTIENAVTNKIIRHPTVGYFMGKTLTSVSRINII